MSDDYSGDISTTGKASLDEDIWGNLDTSNDKDWFRIDLLAGKTYDLSVLGGNLYGTNNFPTLKLFDDTGSQILSGGNHTVFHNAHSQYTAQTDQTIYLQVANTSGDTGIYTVRVSDVSGSPSATDDYADDISTTTVLTVGTDLQGQIGSVSDVDMFSVNLTAGTSYSFWEFSSNQVQDPLIRIYDSAGTELAAGISANYLPTVSGQYYVSIELDSASTSPKIGSYTLHSSGTLPDDYAADMTTTGVVTVGGSTSGLIGSMSDKDWFAVTLTAGSTYEFELKGASSGTGTLGDGNLYLYDDTGAVVWYGHNGGYGHDVSFDFTATYSGTYYLEAWLNIGVSAQAGTYEVSALDVSAGKADLVGQDAGSAVTLSSGVLHVDELQSVSDADWFAIDVTAGDLISAHIDSATLDTRYNPKRANSFLPTFELVDPSGATVATGSFNSISRDYSFDFHAATTGTYHLAVSTGSTSIAYGGYYGISFDTIVDTVGSTPGTAEIVDITDDEFLSHGFMASNVLETPGDTDWFAMDLQANSLAEFTVEFWGNYAAAGGYVSLYDSSGTLVATSPDDTSTTYSPTLSYVPSADGTYYVSVEANGTVLNNRYSLFLVDSNETGTTLDSSGVQLNNAYYSGSTINGTLSDAIDFGGDVDWHRVYLVKGEVLDLGLHGSATTSGAVGNPLLKVLDADGATLAVNFDPNGSDDARIPSFVAPYTGLYFVSAQSHDPTATGTYELHFTNSEWIDVDESANALTASRLEIDSGAAGANTLDVDLWRLWDEDWVSVRLNAGETYQFDFGSSSYVQLNALGPTLRLVSANGEVLAFDKDSGPNDDARITFTPVDSGTYFLSAYDETGRQAQEMLTGSNLSSFSDDFAGDVGQSGAPFLGEIWTGLPVTGAIQSIHEEDWFEIDLFVGSIYRFDLSGTGATPLADPHLMLLDSNGNRVTQDFDSGSGENASLNFTPGVSGTYYLVAAAEDVELGDYTLQAELLSWNGGWTADAVHAVEILTAPIAGFSAGSTSLYSMWQLRNMPVSSYEYFGTEFAGSLGSDVSAGVSGVVVSLRDTISDATVFSDPDLNIIKVGETFSRTDTSEDGLGNYVTVKTDDGLYVTYTNLSAGSSSSAKVGDTVSRTDIIGQIGATGWASSNSASFYSTQVIIGTALIAGTGIADGKTDPTNGFSFVDDSGILIDATQMAASTGLDLSSFKRTAFGFDTDDALSGFSGDTLFYGGDGSDIIYLSVGANFVIGGNGYDYLDVGVHQTGVIADFAASTISVGQASDTVVDVEAIFATQFDDDIQMGGSLSSAFGRNGDDAITGSAFGDFIATGSGDDQADAGDGDDIVTDGFGNDTISGGDGDDLLIVLSGTNLVSGGADDDIVVGGIGNDDLSGGTGNDVIVGDPSTVFFGRDTIDGGTGDDILQGGGGADQFVFRVNDGSDTIGQIADDLSDASQIDVIGPDFVSGLDIIELIGFGYADAAEAIGHVSDSGGNAVFSDQGTSITFLGLSLADLSSDDFLLS